MTQTSNRFFDELAKLVTDTAGAAQGLRKEMETMIRGQAERWLAEMDVVQREEFEAVKAMAAKARVSLSSSRMSATKPVRWSGSAATCTAICVHAAPSTQRGWPA